MSNQNEKTTQELKEELEREKIKAEIDSVRNQSVRNQGVRSIVNDEIRIKRAKTIRNVSIANLCIIPALLTFGILLIVQFVLVLVHDGKEENFSLKIAAAILTFFTLIIGSILSLIYANKELTHS